MGRKALARVRKSLLGSPEKSFLTKSSNIVTRSTANVQPMANFIEQPTPLQKQASFLQDVLSISPPGFPQFTTSTPQLVIFNQPLKEIQNVLVITLLSFCDKRVFVCYGCGHNFRFDTQNPPQPYDLVLVTKQRREFIKDGVKLRSSPANVYFHVQVNNPFYTVFECVQRKMLTFQLHRVQVHVDAIDHFSPTHEVSICQLNVPFFY